jgi:hypothetical protein
MKPISPIRGKGGCGTGPPLGMGASDGRACSSGRRGLRQRRSKHNGLAGAVIQVTDVLGKDD